MNEKNLSFLKDTLKYHGFGEQLNADLEKNISQKFPEFVLRLDTEMNKEKISAALHFRKPEGSDMYFLNKWEGALATENGKVQQAFYFTKGQGITLKEGYNLLNGRAVNTDFTNKEGQKYNAWVQLDFSEKDPSGNFKVKQFHENYGYDLDATLNRFPIKELKDEQQRDRLMMSLKRGNVHPVTLENDSTVTKLFVEANPQYKTLTMYDANMQRLNREDMTKYLVEAPQKTKSLEEKVDQKNNLTVSKRPAHKDGDVSLLQKKRSGHKNGLGRA